MLLQIRIQNYKLIEKTEVNFEEGFNVLTGETGAGKSMLMGALRLALGDRPGKNIHHSLDRDCVIEAVLDPSSLAGEVEKNLADYLAEDDDYLILKRQISIQGRSKNYINGKLVNLSQIRELSSRLVDWHGQFDVKEIFDAATHLEVLDAFGATEPKRHDYFSVYEEFEKIQKRKQAIMDSAASKDRELDLLKFQIEEIEAVGPEPGEDSLLKEEWVHLSHADKLNALTGEILDLLDESSQSASSQIASGFSKFLDWERIDERVSEMRGLLESAQSNLEELLVEIHHYREKLSFEPGRVDEVTQRMDALDLLKKKYGVTLEEVCAFYKESKERYDWLSDTDVNLESLDQQLKELEPQLKARGDALFKLRQKAAKSIEKSILKELQDLEMKDVSFEVRVSRTEENRRGGSWVEFYVSPNAGHDLMPLSEIASGGEASRVLLALKKVVSQHENIGLLIFDEIDANIGGRLGTVVGKKLKEISGAHQVLLVTHLPQIASFGDHHLRVAKSSAGGKTAVSYEPISGDARIEELSHMLSGKEGSDVSVDHAREMLKVGSSEA